jgi:glycine/D-amino acid oxidase-like deaminating enzyme
MVQDCSDTRMDRMVAKYTSYDVVIIGGAMMGASVAWFLSQNPDFDGRILVVERDLTYEWASTTHTNSCLRQQFSSALNIKISQYSFEFMNNFKETMGRKSTPEIFFNSFGYLYLADREDFAQNLCDNQKLQQTLGAGTQILSPEQIAQKFPFYNLDDIILGSHNPVNEGYFDGTTVFNEWRKAAKANGVEFIADELVGIGKNNGRVQSARLKSGAEIACGYLVNCAGPRAAAVAELAGLHIPVEPRKRFTYVFAAEMPLDRDLPLTIDPSGVHMRTDGAYYMAGCAPDNDVAVDYDDFEMDHTLWMDKVWPILASRVPAFETVKVVNEWVGHYAYNTLDQNAIIGPHLDLDNFIFVNGFSGHGLQQAPAMGRGVSEWIVYGAFCTLDLTPLGYARILDNKPLTEQSVI